MKIRTIAGNPVGAVGLGCMGMSFAYGKADQTEADAVFGRALELGVNFWDTADMYGAGHNEQLIGSYLKGKRDKVFLATKFVNVYDRTLTSHQDLVEQNVPWIVDGTPAYMKKAIDLSLQRLGVDHIDLYYAHRVDPRVPIEETVGAMGDLVQAGKIRYVGISEVRAETLQRAHKTFPIAAVQNEFSLWTRDTEEDVLPLCGELGIAYVPYSPLGRGFLTGQIKTIDDLEDGDWRRSNPRFAEENFTKNLELVDLVESVARRVGATPAQVALAWVLSRGEQVVPIPGTKRVKYLEDNAGSAEVQLSPADIEELSAIKPASGERYPEASMKYVNG